MFKKKNALPQANNALLSDLHDSVKFRLPENFDMDKAWREGFLLNVDKTYNPQQFADMNSHIYENNNRYLVYANGFLMLMIVIICSATSLAFWNIDEPRFFTTAPNGDVQELQASTNPNRLDLIADDKHIAEYTKKYFAEHMDEIQWFGGQKPKQLNLTFPHESKGSENNKTIDENGVLRALEGKTNVVTPAQRIAPAPMANNVQLPNGQIVYRPQGPQGIQQNGAGINPPVSAAVPQSHVNTAPQNNGYNPVQSPVQGRTPPVAGQSNYDRVPMPQQGVRQ